MIKNRKCEFFFEAATTVVAVGISRDHFLSVLEKHPKNKTEMSKRIVECYMSFRDYMVYDSYS